MSLIRDISYKDTNYPFVTNDYMLNDRANSFSVIIGSNGTGKSRLLEHVIKATWNKFVENKNNLLYLNNNLFKKIIAITSSPFDKFPEKRLFERYLGVVNLHKTANEYYAYLGLKDDSRINTITPNGQLFKIINSLLSLTLDTSFNFKKLSKTFHLLGYEAKLGITYKYLPNNRLIDDILDCDSAQRFIETNKNGYLNISTRRLNSKVEENHSLFFSIKEALELLEYKYFRDNIELEIDIANGIFAIGDYDDFEAIKILVDVNLIRYQELRLQPIHSDEYISINETSSGERALLLNILGIASEIRDNSLICIDEPEISLHPEWQEKYMRLLMSTFQDYHGCHFIIATHSPKIVSELSDTNCFILNMDDNQVYSSSDYAKRSSDYQLAKLFHTPGFQNEYLLNECLELLSLISSGIEVNESIFHRIEDLTIILPKLNENDPVLKLINTLNKAMEVLKND